MVAETASRARNQKGREEKPQLRNAFGRSWLVLKWLFRALVLTSPSSELLCVLCGGEGLEMNSANSDTGSVRTTAPEGPPHQLE